MNVILCICTKWRWSSFQITVDRRSFYSVLLQAGDDRYIPDVIFMIKCRNFHYSVLQSTSLSALKFFALCSYFTACFLTFPSGCERSNLTKHTLEALSEDFRPTLSFYISVLPLQFKVFQNWLKGAHSIWWVLSTSIVQRAGTGWKLNFRVDPGEHFVTRSRLTFTNAKACQPHLGRASLPFRAYVYSTSGSP